MRQSRTAWMFSIYRLAAATMVTTTCSPWGSTTQWTQVWSWPSRPVTAVPGKAPSSPPGAHAKSSQSPRAQTSTSSASRLPTRRAAEQRSARRWVTSRRCLRAHSACGLTPSLPPAPASIRALPAMSWSSTAVIARLARRYVTRSRLGLSASW